MNAWVMTGLMFAALFVLLAAGLPISFSLGAIAVLFTIFLWGPNGLVNVSMFAFGETQNFIILAVPLFVFMGVFLERSGIADRLYTAAYLWLGRVRGGLAVGTVMICTLFAAMSGVSSSTVLTMGTVAVSPMLKRKYKKDIVLGCVMAGGALGQLIPPSSGLIIYAVFANASVGRLFAGGLFPGLLLATLFSIYILIRCHIQPNLGPSIPLEERAGWRVRTRSLLSVGPPLFIVVLVLGSIYSGIATPTEGAAIGAFGTLICSIFYRSLKWPALSEVAWRTLLVTGMIMFIMIAGKCFTSVFITFGGLNIVTDFVLSLPTNPYMIIVMIQVIWIIMGCFLDPLAITLLTIPIFVPIIKELGFDPVWFGVIFTMNVEIAYLTPPYGMNLFYLKSVAPEGVTMQNIYHSISWFVVLQVLGLALCVIFQDIVLWLPNTLFGAPL
jgi:tripartite ATP-independent transporter DctM subunit